MIRIGYYLSPEIIAIIAEYLESDEFFNFRLVDRYLNECSRTIFVKRYFRQRVHLLTHDSLLTLWDISRDSNFGPFIQELYISSDHLVPIHLIPDPTSLESVPGPFWPSPPGGFIAEFGHENYLIDQEHFQEVGLDTTYLTKILENARNCHTIILNDGERPWGAAIAQRETGFFPTSSRRWDYTRSFLQRAVQVIIAALAASEAHIMTLEFRTEWDENRIHPSMLSLPEYCLGDTLPWISSLTTLRLNVDPNHSGGLDIWANHLGEFINRFSRLKTLGLYFDYNMEKQGFDAFRQILTLPCIRTLELSCIHCLPEDLFDFLYIYRSTLEEILLDSISLDTRNGGSWQSLLSTICDNIRLESFRMSYCFLDDEEIWFGEGDRDISKDIIIKGGGSCSFDCLINGIRRGVADITGSLHVIDSSSNNLVRRPSREFFFPANTGDF